MAPPPKHSLQSVLLALLVLLLLVPGLLLFVDHVRNGKNYNTHTHLKELHRDVSGWNEERSQVYVDEGGFAPLQSVATAADKPVEVAKCEGWRDWIDYGSGWKGCVP